MIKVVEQLEKHVVPIKRKVKLLPLLTVYSVFIPSTDLIIILLFCSFVLMFDIISTHFL